MQIQSSLTPRNTVHRIWKWQRTDIQSGKLQCSWMKWNCYLDRLGRFWNWRTASSCLVQVRCSLGIGRGMRSIPVALHPHNDRLDIHPRTVRHAYILYTLSTLANESHSWCIFCIADDISGKLLSQSMASECLALVDLRTRNSIHLKGNEQIEWINVIL